MDDLSEEMTLAIEIIRQLENLDYSPETILQAMAIISRDTLQKLPEKDRENWRQFIKSSLKLSS